MSHKQKINLIFSHLCHIFNMPDLQLKYMRRHLDEQGRGKLNLKKTYSLAHADLKNKIITIDIYTPRYRKPKAINSILRILAHEIAHYQKPPYKQRYRGKWIIRQHYPEFYQQVAKNIKVIKANQLLAGYFMVNS